MRIIVITGTKGKTTLAFMLDAVLRNTKNKTLLLCSEGLYLNGKRKKDNTYFLEKFKTSANVAGIKELPSKRLKQYDYLVVEASYSSLKNIEKSPLFQKIDLSVLTNVYWDHVDGTKIKDRNDLFHKKLQILDATREGGSVLIYTGDKKDNLSHKALERFYKTRPDLDLISYSESSATDDGLSDFSLKNNRIYHNKKEIINFNDPLLAKINSNYFWKINYLALSAILTTLEISLKCLYNDADNLTSCTPGRWSSYEKNGYNVILDYAHEKKSLTLASKILHQTFPSKKIIAIVRFSYYRTDEYIAELVTDIAGLFDSFVVYDKSISRRSLRYVFANKMHRQPGQVGELVARTLKKSKRATIIINDELTAIEKTIASLKKNEVLYIMGDQIDKNIKTIKKALTKK